METTGAGVESTDWASIASEEVFTGITRQVVHGERQTMVRYVYAPGSVFPMHEHPEEQITVVISGRIAFTVDGQEKTLGPGSVAVIPANVPHGARVLGNETVETFNALSPRRTLNPFAAANEVGP
jgi:quercetin dioxygenase-like cupin family protein